ncbi:MAG: alpha-E domain-containing protein [Chloroflexi bacterium]|nr:MAG: alpha-E domain-containing protein [Chloroflexota bacterium]
MLSRAADSLYWMSRYMERAEHSARLINVHLNTMVGQSPSAAERHWQRFFDSLRIPAPLDENGQIYVPEPYDVIRSLTFDRANPDSLVANISAARENARQIREQLSSEMWEQINRTYLNLNQRNFDQVWNDQPHAFFREIENNTNLFQGLTGSTMMHDEGWRFIQMGGYLERAISTASLVDAHFGIFEDNGLEPLRTDEYLQWVGLLKSCSAFEAYCRIYTPTLHTGHIAEFLVLSPVLPRSLHFCADRMHQAVQQIASITGGGRSQRLTRLTGRLQAIVRYGQIDEILANGLHNFLNDFIDQCQQIHMAIYRAYVDYQVEQEAKG